MDSLRRMKGVVYRFLLRMLKKQYIFKYAWWLQVKLRTEKLKWNTFFDDRTVLLELEAAKEENIQLQDCVLL